MTAGAAPRVGYPIPTEREKVKERRTGLGLGLGPAATWGQKMAPQTARMTRSPIADPRIAARSE